ncbi:hypothetical protein GA0111570_105311 [Raineyella antarctica]|uniref:Uncharacterized protein n=1 Tax=Raineyella antarctica TaxID=1577474 RepID=A0A1G6GYW3_9ACTN|nr:hypothetical protein [Raineyella antarctica]SDB87247.1 hypothetical protein GA0111570_105311 [Raineyella antarctica]
MSEIQPYTSGSTLVPSSSAPWSQHGRAINRLASSTELATLTAAARAQVEQARLDAIDQVAARGMQGVAMVTQFEQQLTQAVPLAASRLQALGDMHALQVAMEISSFTRGLGR